MTLAAAADAAAPNESDAASTPRRPVESRDPSTGEVWKRHAAAGASAMAEAVAAARMAHLEWREWPLRQRLAVLDRFHECLMRRRLEVATTISRENGKPIPEALAAEVLVALDLARYYLHAAPGFLDAHWFTPSSLSMWRKRVRLEREPFGVIGIISPWNYPFMLPAGVVIPALAMGNGVVLKPSEFTPTCGALLAELFAEAGLPAGLFSAVQGDGETGRHLTAAPVDKIFFTGSVATGRAVGAACGARLIPCVLELGGSDAAIVLDDADVEHAASGITWGRFANCGQTCVAPKRVFAVGGAYEPLVAALTARVQALRVSGAHDGSADVGALIRPLQREGLSLQLEEAVAGGASVRGRAPGVAADGSFFAPTLLTGAADLSRVLREETFGPLLPVVRVRDAEEAIARSNASDFGLGASVWSRSHRRALQVARRLETGTVMINDVSAIAGMADVPHGGVKASGTGRAHGRAGMEECVRVKAIVDDRFTGWRQPWWFGYSPRSSDDLDGFARLAHGRTLRDRISGLPATLRLLFRPERPL